MDVVNEGVKEAAIEAFKEPPKLEVELATDSEIEIEFRRDRDEVTWERRENPEGIDGEGRLVKARKEGLGGCGGRIWIS